MDSTVGNIVHDFWYLPLWCSLYVCGNDLQTCLEFNWSYIRPGLKFLRMEYHLAFLALGCLQASFWDHIFLSCQDMRLLAELPAGKEILSPWLTTWPLVSRACVTWPPQSDVSLRSWQTFCLYPHPDLPCLPIQHFLPVFPLWLLAVTRWQTADRNTPGILLDLDGAIGTIRWRLSNSWLAVFVSCLRPKNLNRPPHLNAVLWSLSAVIVL